MTTIGKMSQDELIRLIDERIRERGRVHEMLAEIHDEQRDTRTWEEVKESIERNRWTPPPGTPSAVELIRQDRDQ